MSKRVQTSGGKTIALSPDNLVGRGGEGSVYRLPGDPQYAIKIYSKQPTDATARKLSVMVKHPPKVLANDGRVVIAWPVNLVKSQGRVAGFRMPLVVGGKQISTCYLPLECREVYPHFTFEHLTSIALNLATVVASIHGRGYVIGDIKDQNVLVLPDTTVALVDTDSFQIRDPDTNVIYPCTVKSREFAAPELRGMPADIERTCNHDCFGLAVLIFHLLYQGYHPFAGRYTGKGEQPSFDEVLAKGWYPYASTPNIPYEPPLLVPPRDLLPPNLWHLFLQAFSGASAFRKPRPSAAEWRGALQIARRTLTKCKKNPARHMYFNHTSACPWCSYEERMRASFPRNTMRVMQGMRALRTGITKQQGNVPAPGLPATSSGARPGKLAVATAGTVYSTPSAYKPAVPVVPRPVRRRRRGPFLLALILLIVVGYYAWYKPRHEHDQYVHQDISRYRAQPWSDPTLPLRSGPGTAWNPIAEIPSGEEVQKLDDTMNQEGQRWARVSWRGLIGYVRGNRLDPIYGEP